MHDYQDKAESSDVFEMILNTVDNPSGVAAKPSDFRLPNNWHEDHQEGQLAVDVAETEKEILLVSTMAGAQTGKIEVYVHNDLLTIRGERLSPLDKEKQSEYFYQECFWGKFSRTIVLPVDVKGELAKAEYHNGVLVIRIPKHKVDNKIPVVVVDE